MFLPIIEPGMKKSGELFCFWIKARKVCSLVTIAVVTGEREIFQGIFTAVLAWDDVFDVKSQRFKILMQPTILASVFGALADGLAQPGFHQRFLARTRRAFA